MLISYTLNCIKEIKRLYREYKQMTDTDKEVLETLISYWMWVSLIPFVIYSFLESKSVFYNNLYYLMFVTLAIIYFISYDLNYLLKNKTTLDRFSKNFKYYTTQKSIVYWKNYLTGGRYSEEKK